MAYKNRQYAIEYGKEYRAMCKRLHLCVYCMKKDAYTLGGRSACYECAEKMAKSKKVKYYSTEEARQKRCEERRKLRQRHIENHECAVCGKKLDENYRYKTCSACRKYNAIRQRKNDTFMRGKFGICWQCNKEPCIEGKRVCRKCYEMKLKILSKIKTDNSSHPWRSKIYGRKVNKKQSKS